MTPIIAVYIWALSGLAGIWLYILTRYKLSDSIDAQDLVEGILVWVFGPFGFLIALSYWGDKLGWKIKIYRKDKS